MMIVNRFLWTLSVGSLLLSTAACDDDDVGSAALLSAPSGLTVAGSARDQLFIANSAEDALRVLDLSDGINDADFVAGPSVFNPLRIPVGPSPSDVIASDDGRVVAVLDPIGAALRLVDADSRLLQRTSDGDVYIYPLGPENSAPVDLEPDPTGCFGSCLGRFFVSLSGTGQVLTLSFIETDDGFRVGLESVFEVGGRPQRIAASPDGRLLFTVDADSDEVVRIDRLSGVVDRQPVGAPPGDVAVSGDGTTLLVARPVLRDVLLFSDIAGAWSVFPSDSRLSPPLICLEACAPEAIPGDGEAQENADDDALECVGSHPANSAVCHRDFEGLELSGVPYQALYVGVIPRRIETMSTLRGHLPLEVDCFIDDDEDPSITATIDEYAVVIGESNFAQPSTNRWITLRDEVGGELAPALSENGGCQEGQVTISDLRLSFVTDEDDGGEPVLDANGDVISIERDAELSDFLTDCPELPELARFECLDVFDDEDVRDESLGVVVVPGGRPGSTEWRLEWEAPLVGLRRTAGGGTLTGGGQVLSDEDFELTERQVRINDIVRILTAPRTGDEECAEALGNPDTIPDPCNFERRVIGYRSAEELGDGFEFGGLVLGGEQLPASCFSTEGALSYEIRAGDSFVVGRTGNTQAGRVRIGEIFGPGGEFGRQEGVVFQMRSDLSGDIEETDACVRYSDDNLNRSPQIVRDQLFRFIVEDTTLFLEPGRDRLSELTSFGAGASPSAAVLGTAPVLDDDGVVTDAFDYLFVTYEATDTLLIFRPDQPLSTDDSNDPGEDFRFLN